ncbi:Uncharacterized protein APZ42_002750, partial [Daphnia magna]
GLLLGAHILQTQISAQRVTKQAGVDIALNIGGVDLLGHTIVAGKCLIGADLGLGVERILHAHHVIGQDGRNATKSQGAVAQQKAGRHGNRRAVVLQVELILDHVHIFDPLIQVQAQLHAAEDTRQLALGREAQGLDLVLGHW